MMKASIIFFCLFIFLQSIGICHASAIGVVPDRIIFNGTEERLMIVNPNNLSVDFSITADGITCTPSQGKVAAKDRADVVCEATEHALDGVILVEMEGDDKTLGILPAVAIKADVIGNETKIKPPETDPPAGLLEITGAVAAVKAAEAEQNQTGHDRILPEGLQGLETELVTIALLVAAIASLLIYTEVRDRKQEKTKINDDPETTSAPCASLTQDVQDDLPSASAAASPDQPLSTLLHDAPAQNQLSSHPERSP